MTSRMMLSRLSEMPRLLRAYSTWTWRRILRASPWLVAQKNFAAISRPSLLEYCQNPVVSEVLVQQVTVGQALCEAAGRAASSPSVCTRSSSTFKR